MSIVLEDKVDTDKSAKFQVLAHVREEASELKQLVLDRESHPIFEAPEVRKNLLTNGHKACLNFEDCIDLCVEVRLSLIISTIKSLGVWRYERIFSLKEIIDNLVGSKAVSEFCCSSEILSHDGRLFIESHLIEV
jgi:hypothetical protein